MPRKPLKPSKLREAKPLPSQRYQVPPEFEENEQAKQKYNTLSKNHRDRACELIEGIESMQVLLEHQS